MRDGRALLHALEWAISNERATSIVECNPTTSWVIGGHDLVTKCEGDATACFEISDVASKRNNNAKLDKDVATLIASAHTYRYLAVSGEWGSSLPRPRDKSLESSVVRFRREGNVESTWIFLLT